MSEKYTCKVCENVIPYTVIKTAQHKNREPKFCSWDCYLKGREITYGYDSDFMREDNELSAYFFGLFVTDGHFEKTGDRIVIGSVDEQLILSLVEKTKYELIPQVRNPKLNSIKRISGKKPFYTLKFSGDVVTKIRNSGFIPGAKTGKEFVPERCKSINMFPHFLRGVIDGDGSIMHMKNGSLTSMIVCTNTSFLQTIFSLLQQYQIVRGGTIVNSERYYYNTKDEKVKGKTMYYLIFSHFDTVSICNFMYKDCTIKLDRKYNKFLAGKDFILSQTIQKNTTCSYANCSEPSHAKGLCLTHYAKERGIKRRTTDRISYLKKRKELYLKNADRERARSKQWKLDNPEKVRETKRKYRETHKEEVNAQKRDYRNRNIEKIREQENASYWRNKDKKLERCKEYYEENKEKILKQAAEYRAKNKEKNKEYFKKRYQEKKEEILRKNKERYEAKKAAKEQETTSEVVENTETPSSDSSNS